MAGRFLASRVMTGPSGVLHSGIWTVVFLGGHYCRRAGRLAARVQKDWPRLTDKGTTKVSPVNLRLNLQVSSLKSKMLEVIKMNIVGLFDRLNAATDTF